MTDEPVSKLPGYAEGFRRGRARTEAEQARLEELGRKDLADQRLREAIVYAMCMHTALNAQGWQTGDKKPITNLPMRMDLADSFFKAYRERRGRP